MGKSHKLRGYWREHARSIMWLVLAALGLAWLLLHKLGTLTTGLSPSELQAAAAPVGWHGAYHHPLDLPLQVVRSIVFVAFPNHGALLSRLPNVFFGGLAVICFGWLIWLWHGPRTMVLSTLLFACSAWTLHVSRFASYDVMYLWATPVLLLTQLGLQQHSKRASVWYASLLATGLLLTIPGMVWLVVVGIYLQRVALAAGWKRFGAWWQRLVSLLAVVIWLPLIGVDLGRSGQLVRWLGLPAHYAAPATLAKQFAAVLVHLFVRGPQYPTLWLGRTPILDVLSLVACLLGLYFYIAHWRSRRSRLLGSVFIIGVILIGLGGPVGLSLLVPLMYMAAATGLAYLLHDWLHIFPQNPLARSLGIGLVAIAVGLSCMYNLRAYFVAWPHNSATEASFHSDRP